MSTTWPEEAHASIDALLAPKRRRPAEPDHDATTLKKCRVCCRPQPLTSFMHNAKSADGRQHICFSCNPVTNGRKSKRCTSCEGMAWRREKPFCGMCCEPFAEEPAVELDTASRKSVNDHLGFGR